MINVEMVEVYADKLKEGPVVIEFSEFEGFNRLGVEMSRMMFVCLEVQIKKCVNVLGIDRREARSEVLVWEKNKK